MANEVDITITAKDLSGPAFAGAISHVAALRAAIRGLRDELRGLAIPGLDPSKMQTSLMLLKSKLQSLHIADIADVNVQPGLIMTQLNLLKRLIQQAGISDILDINVSQGNLTKAISNLTGLSETIPVHFAVDAAPKIPAIAAPIVKQTGFGTSESVGSPVSASTLAAMNALTGETYKLQAGFGSLMPAISSVSNVLGSKLNPYLVGTRIFLDRVRDSLYGIHLATNSAAGTGGGGGGGGSGLIGLAAAAAGGWRWFGAFNARIPLFASALAGIPFFGAISGFHLIAESALEIAAVLIPASAAFIAFGIASVGTVMDISRSMNALWTTTHALNQNIFPLTGSMKALEDSVAPAVWNIFGQALIVANAKTAVFTKTAQDASHVVQDLSARMAVALTSGGLDQFIKNARTDLAVVGDITGNIFGTIGNVLHAVPGYAEVLFGALDGLTKGLEAVTGSTVGQWALKVGLAFHGFVVWAGLGATAAVLLGNGMLTLASRFGLVTAGLTVFNAAMFGTGVKQMIGGVGLLATEMVTLGAGEDIAAAGALTLEGAWMAITAINPIVWAGVLIGGLIALTLWLGKSTSATASYNAAVNGALQNSPVSQLNVNLVKQMANTTGMLSGAQRQLTADTAAYNAQSATEQIHNTAISRAYKNQQDTVAGLKGEISTLSGFQANYNKLLVASGNNLSFVSDAGITSNDIMNASAEDMKKYIIEVQAAAAAQDALSLGTGRAAAAQNAQTNIFMQETVPAMQKVTQAEDNLLNVILGGQESFNQFQQSIQGTTARFVAPTGLADAFKLAGGNLTGLNEQSLAFSNTLYGISIPALQKTIDATQMQGISTDNLTKIVATGSGQMLQYTGSNAEARGVIVDLINNALGPGTVSLQTLNTWVGKNSTSLDNMNSIVAQATINAGILSNTLAGALNSAMVQAMIDAGGGQKVFSNFATSILETGTNSQQTKTDALALSEELFGLTHTTSGAHDEFITFARDALGLTKSQAETLWQSTLPGLQGFINGMHGTNIPITATFQTVGDGSVQVSGTGLSTATLFVASGTVQKIGGHTAKGALITDGTTSTADDVILAASKGELIVPANLVDAGYADNMRGMIPGFKGGGVVGDPYAPFPPFIAGKAGPWFDKEVAAGVQSMISADVKTLQARAAAAAAAQAAATKKAGLNNLPLGSGPTSGNAAIAQAFAKSILWAYGWGMDQWPYELALWNQESGWNAYAANPTSNARGIPQNINGWSAYAPGDYQAQIRWGDAYISSRYGNPAAAWAHEVGYNWYKHGGLVGMASGGLVDGRVPGWNALSASVYREMGDFWKLTSADKIPGSAARSWSSAMKAQQLKTIGLGRNPGGAFDVLNTAMSGAYPGDTPVKDWLNFQGQLNNLIAYQAGIGIPGGKNPPGTPKNSGWAAWRYQNRDWTKLRKDLLGLRGAADIAYQDWQPVTHTYGGDVVVNSPGATLAAQLGNVGTFDNGGWLKPGMNPPMYNGTGGWEHLTPDSGGGREIRVKIELGDSFRQAGLTVEQLRDIRYEVKTRGGGDVQKAFGTH